MVERDVLEADGLRSFAVFAEHRNFTTAAAALHISQPSLHVKIRNLGQALGVRLYERDGRRLILTEAGRRLAAYASDARQRLDDFLRELDEGTGTLTIAAGRGALRWVVAEPLRHITRTGRRLHVITANREAALDALGTGRADLAVIAHDPPPAPLESADLASYPQVLVIPAGHPLAGRRRLCRTDLAGLDLVVPPPDRPHRRALDRALLDAGVSWQVVAEADGWDLLVHFVALGIGATVVNGCVDLPDGLVAVPVADLSTVRYWAVWRRQRATHVAAAVHELRAAHPRGHNASRRGGPP